MKFGGSMERMQLNRISASSPGGFFKFGSLSDFLTNQPDRFTAGLTPLYAKSLRQTLIGFYAQDDWRLRPNLTLNIGVRWEATTVPTEIHGKFAILTHITDATPQLGSPFFSNPTLRNFAPRVGFAWDPFHNGKTALRGGFGIFDSLPMIYQYLTMIGQSAPFFLVKTANLTTQPNKGAGSFPSGAFAAVVASNKSNNQYAALETHPRRNYVM